LSVGGYGVSSNLYTWAELFARSLRMISSREIAALRSSRKKSTMEKKQEEE